MLRTLLGIILLSIFVTPVFAAPTPLTPQMLSPKQVRELYNRYAEGVSEHKRDDGSIILFILADGSSTNNALCNVLGYLKSYAEAEPNSADITSKINSALPKGMYISHNENYKQKTVKQLGRVMETTISEVITKIWMNNVFLNCISTLQQIEMQNPVTGETVGEAIEKDIIEINTDSSGSIISVSDFQGARIAILEYGALAEGTEIRVIIVMGIKL